MTVKEKRKTFANSLLPIYDIGEAKSITRIIFEDVFSLFEKNAQQEFPEKNNTKLEEIKTRLLANEPIQYILGQADFYGYKFSVDSNVLIPRQETEELVYWIKNTIRKEYFSTDELNLLDIGTGTGCIPICLKKIFPEINISALDVSKQVIDIASKNATQLNADISFFQKNILDIEDRNSLDEYDIIISNPPYIPENEKSLMPDWVKKHEPSLALFVSNDDPLIFYRVIANFAMFHLKPKGYLFFEINENNSKDVIALLEDLSFQEIKLEKDMQGKDRMIGAKLS